MYDIVIKNGTVIDGSGAPSHKSDIAIVGERIVFIGKLPESFETREIIDATGKLVTPGFIDMHSHADQTILAFPQMESMIHQGITTFVGGMCGQSIAPTGTYWLGNQAEFDILAMLIPKLYPDMYDNDYYTMSKDTIPLIEKLHGFKPDWKNFGEWLDKIDSHGTSGNIVCPVGYSSVRMNVMGPDGNRPPTKNEMQAMKKQLDESLEGGAFGLSTGLDYKPGIFSSTAELMEITSELKKYEGSIYFTHWRKTGLRAGTPKKQKKIDGIIEALNIGMTNDIQVQISHISTGFDIFPANDDFMQVASAQRTLQVIDEHIERGANAYFDVIPNITGGTMIAPDLITIFKPWYKLTGGIDLFVNNLKFADYREQISSYISAGKYFILNPIATPDWDESIKILACKKPEWVGKTITELAKQLKKDNLNTVFDVLIRDPQTKIFRATHSMNLNATKTYLAHPRATVGNDTFVFDLVSTVGYNPKSPANKPNPNTYCGFIKYMTDLRRASLEDTVHAITGRAAAILGLTDRGLIKNNYRADILILNDETLSSNENLIEPRVYPTGVEYVFVNGVTVIKEQKHTGARPGGSIRRYKK